jgi:hypothetical protein
MAIKTSATLIARPPVPMQFFFQHLKKLLSAFAAQFALQFLQCKAKNVVVVQARSSQMLCSKFEVLLAQTRRVRAKVILLSVWSGVGISRTTIGAWLRQRSQASPVSLPCSSTVSLLERPQTMREDSSLCAVCTNSVEDIGRRHHHQRNVLALLLGQLHHLGEQMLLVLLEQLPLSTLALPLKVCSRW